MTFSRSTYFRGANLRFFGCKARIPAQATASLPARMPSTGGELPLPGLVGLVCLGAAGLNQPIGSGRLPLQERAAPTDLDQNSDAEIARSLREMPADTFAHYVKTRTSTGT